jgi:protein-disulfide isomerase
MESEQPSLMPVAIAIVFVGVVIAFALYLALRPAPQTAFGPNGEEIQIPPVTEADHILGNPNAPVVIVEYSDLDCPYCRVFNATMKQIMATYGDEGKVAWVYRHFPIVELHPNAARLAEASECVAEIGGNAAFWKFVDGVFTSPVVNDKFDMTRLDATAASAGVSSSAFSACMEAGTYRKKVAEQFDEATEIGALGTPHSIVLSTTAPPIPVAGSQPYATIRSIIDTLLPEE